MTKYVYGGRGLEVGQNQADQILSGFGISIDS